MMEMNESPYGSWRLTMTSLMPVVRFRKLRFASPLPTNADTTDPHWHAHPMIATTAKTWLCVQLLVRVRVMVRVWVWVLVRLLVRIGCWLRLQLLVVWVVGVPLLLVAVRIHVVVVVVM
jgi:hypothetical protein